MRHLSYLLLSVASFALLQGPVQAQPKKDEPKKGQEPKKGEALKTPPKTDACCAPGHSLKHLDGQLLVFVVNGAGGSTMLSDNLLDVNGEKQLGLKLQIVPWCRTNSVVKDVMDTEAQLNAAGKIACAVTAIRKECPNAHIYFIGHSAGAHVVLVAAEMVPAKSIDRVIVLSPAVSSTYDLTRALKATRYGIDNFFSSEDSILDRASEVGLADGMKGLAAGRIGFRLDSCDKKDIEAYKAVRQIRWTEDYHGNGGHFVWTRQHNLKKAVVPAFFTAPVSDGPCLEKMPPAK